MRDGSRINRRQHTVAVLVVCLEEGVFSSSFPLADNERNRVTRFPGTKGFYRQVMSVVSREEEIFSSFPTHEGALR